MSNNFGDFYSEQAHTNTVCSVAYTLNNEQPVICTHIGDQPLFYIDEENVEEETAIFDEAELAMLAGEINALKGEIKEYENIFAQSTAKTLSLIDAFAENAESLTEDRDQSASADEIIEHLKQSRLGAAYLNTAEKHNIDIKISNQIETAQYDRRNGSILIHGDLNIEEQILLLARELRRHWQHRQGALINPLLFQPEHSILVNRMQEADLAVSMIRIGWELQLAGQRNVWERIEKSPMADLARAFAHEAFLDFRSLNDGRAAATALEAWFLSERCRVQDKAIIQKMLNDHKGYVFENIGTSESVTVELIAALGSMPFGKNYLSSHATIILEDPVFIEVRDRSSANFLWFIKFERSCKETEQELQLDPDLSTRDVRHVLLDEQDQGNQNGQKHNADIIQLYEYAEQSPRKNPRPLSGSADHKAEIINLEQWAKAKSTL